MYDHFSAVIAHGVTFSKFSSKLLRKLYDFSPKTTTDVIFWFSCLLKINSAITIHKRTCMDWTFLADTDSEKKIYPNGPTKRPGDHLRLENRTLNV